MTRDTTSRDATLGQQTRALTRALAQAPDQQIARAVALLDALPERGAADALIAPLRRQLGTMGIPRRMNFGRLLFLPLDPVIRDASAGRWADGAAVPRTALPPLIAAVRNALPDLAAATAAELRADPDIASAACTLGPPLWAAAPAPLRALATASGLPGWTESGLPPASLAPIATGVAAVLELFEQLRGPEAALGDALARTATTMPDAWPLVVAVALARAPDPATAAMLAMARAERGSPALHRGLEQGLATATEILEREAQAPIRAAAAATARAARIIEAVAPRAGPARRAALAAFAARIAAACHARFAGEMEGGLLAPLRSLAP
ncbi:MAG: hypothetical protein KGL52_14555, partial [Rhodospirillales bacterium]|nr:hypothetical protein [Rhodospirillales bacterium]